MNLRIVLPKRKGHLTLSQWMCKHKVSTQLMSLDIAICKALNYLDNE
jgi:hypothetical protein